MAVRRREAGGLVAGVVGFILGVVVALAVPAFVRDLPPSGPQCDYYRRQTDSGPSRSGSEAIQWTPLPERVCWVEGEPPRSGTDVVDFAIAGVAGAVIGGIAGVSADRGIGRRETNRVISRSHGERDLATWTVLVLSAQDDVTDRDLEPERVLTVDLDRRALPALSFDLD